MSRGYRLDANFIKAIENSIAVTKSIGKSSEQSKHQRKTNIRYIKLSDKADEIEGAEAIEFSGTSVEFDTETSSWIETTPVLNWSPEETRLFVTGGADNGDIVTAYPIRDTEGVPVWMGMASGGGDVSLQESFIINLIGGSGTSYTGTVVGHPELGTVPVSAPSINGSLTLPFSVNYTSTSQTTIGEVVTYIIQPLVFL